MPSSPHVRDETEAAPQPESAEPVPADVAPSATPAPEAGPVREAPLEDAPAGAAGPADPRWWGEVRLAVGQVARVRAGPSTVHLQRLAAEWRVWREQSEDPYAPVAERAQVQPEPPTGTPSGRYSFAAAPDVLYVRAALADRPVVIRPEGALAIGGGQTVTLFVSTPAWLSLTLAGVANGKGRRDVLGVLWEAPTHRPSDTWFGTSTLDGELCYAVRTAGRLAVGELPLRPHRAVTPLTIVNEARAPLVLDRVQVPLPQLALHVDRDGRLWTDGVRFTREADGDDAALRVVPAKLQGGERLATPRTPASPNVVLKAFSRFFKGDAS
jgi:hypothetical protein